MSLSPRPWPWERSRQSCSTPAFPGRLPTAPATLAEALLFTAIVSMRVQAALEAPIALARVPVVYLRSAIHHVPAQFHHAAMLIEGAQAARPFRKALGDTGPVSWLTFRPLTHYRRGRLEARRVGNHTVHVEGHRIVRRLHGQAVTVWRHQALAASIIAAIQRTTRGASGVARSTRCSRGTDRKEGPMASGDLDRGPTAVAAAHRLASIGPNQIATAMLAPPLRASGALGALWPIGPSALADTPRAGDMRAIEEGRTRTEPRAPLGRPSAPTASCAEHRWRSHRCPSPWCWPWSLARG